MIPRWIWIAIGMLIVLSLALSWGSLSAVARTRRTERQRRRLAADVGLLQGALLPAVPERLGGATTSVAYRPADGPAAGGDFYDVWELSDGRVAAIVGDVSGHGRAALPQTALIRYTLRAYLDAGLAPRRALGAGAAALDRQLQASFATVVLAIYDPRARTLTYAAAGHPPPVVLGSGTLEPVLEGCSPPVGTGAPTGLRETTVRLPGHAQVFFYTDGVIEARAEGELFGTERLTGTVRSLGESPTAQEVLDEVVSCSDSRPDDMAACLLSIPGGEDAPELEAEELELRGDHIDWQGAAALLAACGVEPRRVQDAILRARGAVARDRAAILRVRPRGRALGRRGGRLERRRHLELRGGAPGGHGRAPEVEVAPAGARITRGDQAGAELALPRYQV